MIPPIYHSLRRESIKNTNSASAIGVKSVRPTWFEDIVTSREPAYHAGQEQPEPMHGLKLVIKEEALPLKEQPEFPAPAELAKRGLLATDTWSCKRAQISLKATIDVPMLHTFFFLPTPSWLSPGRYTRSTAAKKMNCKLACKAVNSSIASKALVMDKYTVQ